MVVAGGGALLPGLCARLAEEIKALVAPAADTGLGNPQGYAWARAVVSGENYRRSGAGGSGSSSAAISAAGAAAAEEELGGGGSGGTGGGGGTGLCVVRVPVRRDELVWTGASIMASLPRIADRSLTSEQYLDPSSSTSSSRVGRGRGRAVGGGGDKDKDKDKDEEEEGEVGFGGNSATGRGGGGRLPDWMSVSPTDWLFEATTTTAVAGSAASSAGSSAGGGGAPAVR